MLNILLAASLVLLSAKMVMERDNEPVGPEKNTDAAMENIMTRKSVRDYESKAVEDEKVERLLKAAMSAPSARNKQPWRFVVVKEKETLRMFSGKFKSMGMAEKAPLAIVVCGERGGDAYWVQDASAATENMLLAAHAMGLGAVWCGVYPASDRVAEVSAILSLPDSIVPLCVVPVGYPAEDPAPKDKWRVENIRYGKWDNSAATGK